MSLKEVLDQFESELKDFAIKSSYKINKLAPNNYDIELNIPNAGKQKLTVIVDGSDLTIKGKIIEVAPKGNNPISEILTLIDGVVDEWIGQSTEVVATSEAKSAAADATLKLGRPVHAIVKLLPSGTTSENMKDVVPVKEFKVEAPNNPVSSSVYKR